MFKLNLKIAWRNLLKHKGYAAVNILGLALGLAGFIFMVLFINHEKSYDKWDRQLENVYQAQEHSDYYSTDKKAHWINTIDLRLSKILANDIPGVKAVTMVNPEYHKEAITIPGKKPFLQSGIRRCDSLFFNVMPYTFKYGNAEKAFSNPHSIVLKEHLAKKLFGDVNPVSKTLTIAGGNWRGSEDIYTVTGVIKETSTPSVLNFEAVYFADAHYFNVNDDNGQPAEIYVKTLPFKDLDQVNKTVQKAYLPVKNAFLERDKSSVAQKIKEGNEPQFRIAKLADVHQAPLEQKSWKETLKPVLLLSVLLLLVSIINFINLATAQAAGRAKEIGIKKVIGAYKHALMLQFLVETFIQCLLALFIALFLVEILLPTLNSYFALDLSLINSIETWKLALQLFGVTVIVSFLTGFYPALFLTSYKPKAVLKGNFETGKSGAMVRKALVSVQFVVSVSFIIGILMVNYQLHYLKDRDNGFTSTGLINVRMAIPEKGRGSDLFTRLKRVDGVKYVAYSSGVIGDNASTAQDFKYKGDVKQMHGIAIGMEGLQALDARLIAGRFFSPDIASDTTYNVIINEAAAKLFTENMVGKQIMSNDTTALTVVGVIKDIQVEGFEKAVDPSLYVVPVEKWKNGVSSTYKQTALIRFEKGKANNVFAELEKIYAERNEFYPVNYTFVTDDLSEVLIAHERFEKMIALFSILSLSLSLFGLFSLAAFITKQRTKEIAVRKVLGAENTDILVLLNKGYVWIILIANAIAFPLTYILINRWLSTFAYRTSISATPFILAFLASVVITIITVSLQAKKAINANPVKALKYE